VLFMPTFTVASGDSKLQRLFVRAIRCAARLDFTVSRTEGFLSTGVNDKSHYNNNNRYTTIYGEQHCSNVTTSEPKRSSNMLQIPFSTLSVSIGNGKLA